ncbi:autotransporter outer membrane beta-barrel domain-containing protein [Bathymodiolus thermophilus thioautotrophic gill symbiont]|uniref:Cadherin domain-containing protein n=1 Tax=Bathymodiolus thermophilus thioautotrophic gill symbiont TaxID=2360 RepID=A0A8H8XAB5_9GAMM|nr:autotransporter outer membrane beta-barrel domain-containing protein [Bathymodiolus thermophilus thioautotrophic gill symbiont]CAB5496258.1 hypothetical protein THERMOS_469 [Bathymodiolus thermophilus thioautotrophic gill symbiont]
MNILNRFIVSALLVLFASQTFAIDESQNPVVIKVERTSDNTMIVTFNQPVKLPASSSTIKITLYSGTTYYVGEAVQGRVFETELINPVSNYSQQMKIKLNNGFAKADESGNNSATLILTAILAKNTNNSAVQDYIKFNFIFAKLVITSDSALNTNKGSIFNHLLTAIDPAAIFSITEDSSGLFSLNNNTLTFNATNTNTTSYTVKIKATTGTRVNQNAEQTITITVNDTPLQQKPSVNVSKKQTITQVTLEATATDPDGDDNALTYQWTQTAGTPSVTLANANTATATFTPTDAMSGKTLTFKVTVTDTDNKTTEVSISVTITRALTIITDNIVTPENADKIITLVANKEGATFVIVEGADASRFTINGNDLTFKATDYEKEKDSKTYSVNIKATKGDETATKTITVTLTNIDEAPTNLIITGGGKIDTGKLVTLTAHADDVDSEITYTWTQTTGTPLNKDLTNTPTISFTTTPVMEGETFTFKVVATGDGQTIETTTTVTVNNAETTAIAKAAAIRKESKAAVKILLSRVSKTIISRLSYLRHQQNKRSNFDANGFAEGIQVNFADTQTNTLVNHILNANELNNTIKTPIPKINSWDTWTSAKIVIGESNGENTGKTKFSLKSFNIGIDKQLNRDTTLGFSLGFGKEERTVTGNDFSGDVDTNQWSLSSYGALEIDKQNSIEAILGITQGAHKTNVINQNSNSLFASIAYRANLQTDEFNLSPFLRYDINSIKITDNILTSETATDNNFAIGIDINNEVAYQNSKLNHFLSVEYKANLGQNDDEEDYLSQNTKQEIELKIGIDYQEDDTSTSVNYQRIQSTNNEAYSNIIEGTLRWKF